MNRSTSACNTQPQSSLGVACRARGSMLLRSSHDATRSEKIGQVLEVVFVSFSGVHPLFDALAGWDAANACASQQHERVFLGLEGQSCNYRGPFGGEKGERTWKVPDGEGTFCSAWSAKLVSRPVMAATLRRGRILSISGKREKSILDFGGRRCHDKKRVSLKHLGCISE